MSKTAAIIGFGELGKQFYNHLVKKDYNNFFFFDDFELKSESALIHKFNKYKDQEYELCDFYVALGYKNLSYKHKLIFDLKENNRHVPKFIHSTTYIDKSSVISDAVFIYPMCNIDKNVKIQIGTLVNNSVVISHDSIIGSCCYISPGVVVSGNVTVGDHTFIGSGSIISNNVKIGNNVNIGIGSVVTKDIPDNTDVIGNPMKFLIKKLSL
jgi:sugar O-acyltransferase (sialic acid O-acetyltransferase NeuD family)